MYVCLCNRLTEEMIKQAVDKGARTHTDVLRHFRLRRGCSICTVQIAEAIDRARQASTLKAAE